MAIPNKSKIIFIFCVLSVIIIFVGDYFTYVGDYFPVICFFIYLGAQFLCILCTQFETTDTSVTSSQIKSRLVNASTQFHLLQKLIKRKFVEAMVGAIDISSPVYSSLFPTQLQQVFFPSTNSGTRKLLRPFVGLLVFLPIHISTDTFTY